MTEKKWIKQSDEMPPYRDNMYYWVVSKVHGLLPTPKSHSQLFDHYQAADLEAYASIDPPPPLPKVYADGEWRPMSEPIPDWLSEVLGLYKDTDEYPKHEWHVVHTESVRSNKYQQFIAWQPVPACLRAVPEWVKESGDE